MCVTDLYGFIGTVVAGIVIVTSGFSRADSIASLVGRRPDAQGRLGVTAPRTPNPFGGHPG